MPGTDDGVHVVQPRDHHHLGYGDLVPASPLRRLLAGAEALVGQIYLVTFVGMVVGPYAAVRHESPESGDRTDGAVSTAG